MINGIIEEPLLSPARLEEILARLNHLETQAYEDQRSIDQIQCRISRLDSSYYADSLPAIKNKVDLLDSRVTMMTSDMVTHLDRHKKTITTILNMLAEPITGQETLDKTSSLIKERFRDIVDDDLKEYKLRIYKILHTLVDSIFHDPSKTLAWFNTDNPLLGGISPNHMIEIGRHEKLMDFVVTAIQENQAP